MKHRLGVQGNESTFSLFFTMLFPLCFGLHLAVMRRKIHTQYRAFLLAIHLCYTPLTVEYSVNSYK